MIENKELNPCTHESYQGHDSIDWCENCGAIRFSDNGFEGEWDLPNTLTHPSSGEISEDELQTARELVGYLKAKSKELDSLNHNNSDLFEERADVVQKLIELQTLIRQEAVKCVEIDEEVLHLDLIIACADYLTQHSIRNKYDTKHGANMSDIINKHIKAIKQHEREIIKIKENDK